jgi:transposase
VLDRFGVQKRSLKEANVKKGFPEEAICADFNTSFSMSETARRFNTTVLTVSRILERRGLRVRLTGVGRPSNLTEHKQKIVDLYNNGWSISKIRDEVGVNTNTTNYTRLLKEAGVKIRSRGKQNAIYSVNEDYFSKIDSPIKAYIMGLIYTDGSVRTRPKKKFLLELHKDDEDTVQLVKREIGYTGPLYYTDKNTDQSWSMI